MTVLTINFPKGEFPPMILKLKNECDVEKYKDIIGAVQRGIIIETTTGIYTFGSEVLKHAIIKCI